MTTTNFVAKFFHYNFVTKHLKKKSRKYFLKIVNVQINGATISWTCLSSLYFVLSLGSPTSIQPPHTQYFGLFILHIYLFRGKNRFEKLPNWLLVQHWGGITQLAHFTMFPVVFNTKARPFDLLYGYWVGLSCPISRGLSWSV